MNRFYRRNRLIAAVLLGMILAGGFWATPSLRVLAQELINFFIPDYNGYAARFNLRWQRAASRSTGTGL